MRIVGQAARKALCVVVALVGLATKGETAAAAPRATSRFVVVQPSRLVDTRDLGPQVSRGSIYRVQVAGRFGVGSTATAAVINLTATEALGAGFLTAWSGDVVRPLASNIGIELAGQTVSNLVTVPLGHDGTFAIYASVGTHLVVDVFGGYEPVPESASGRLSTVSPTRVFDSRESTGRRTTGSTTRVSLSRAVPPTASAVVLNLTIDDATGPGFWTVTPAGATRSSTSNLNVGVAHQTLANQVIVPVTDSAIDVFSQSGGHMIVDVVGWFTGHDDPVSTDGLFVAVNPARVLDTREVGMLNPTEDQVKPRAGWTTEVLGELRRVVPATASAVALNMTAAHAEEPGFVTAWGAGTPRPLASNLNAFRRGQVVANHVITPLGTRGIAFFTQQQTHLIADVAGYFLGKPMPSVLPAPNLILGAMTTRLSVPVLGLDIELAAGLDESTLDEGPMRWLLSSEAGQLGTVRVLGHRTSHGGPFLGLANLRPGDRIIATNMLGRHVYIVTGSVVVDPDDLKRLEDPTTENLHLIACHPIGSVAQRLVVMASLVE